MERRRKAQWARHRSGTKILRQLAAIASLIVSNSAAEANAVQVAARYDARVVHIETIGTMFNDKQEVGGGSGLLVGDNLVLTNNHVIPRENNYRTLAINVRPKSRHLSPPLGARLVERDADRDLALLELESSVVNAGG